MESGPAEMCRSEVSDLAPVPVPLCCRVPGRVGVHNPRCGSDVDGRSGVPTRGGNEHRSGLSRVRPGPLDVSPQCYQMERDVL